MTVVTTKSDRREDIDPIYDGDGAWFARYGVYGDDDWLSVEAS